MLEESLSVFIPACNEARNIEGAVHDVVWAAAATFADFEVILVDDGSTDGTGEICRRLAATDGRIRLIQNATNRGLGRGYRDALAMASKAHFTWVPGDREVHRDSIRDIFAATGKAEIVVPYHGNPEARTWYRRLMTRVLTATINALFGFDQPYYQGPCLYPIALARRLPKESPGFFFCAEMLIHAVATGHTTVSVPLRHVERAHGRSKAVSATNIAAALLTIGRVFWNIRIRRRDYRTAPPLWGGTAPADPSRPQ